ncbi:CPBP family intramembrane metalloprotease, partial [Dehalococcoidia bacterium]|nr:CPBP family intramembrane metalloprotease [Dehalococcoidia bacterium]
PLPATDVLIYTSIALVMSTLFEEVFFRGFLQTRFEKAFGIFPAIVLSGLTFSLYHLGYPAYRDFNLLMSILTVNDHF